ncbi:M48 family metallopeptidase [Halomonas sp. McH1-25]|uniref:M48 family metallopeptidase n=1 Tax=unclassified Halomonas TaxID=2609666 RepID=UPI001EF6722F|nr:MULTISPECIES: M48 family metallopeptidase [unclassified Halomonas]MCG7601166.1 M48 family metallopeptidase [Halomonas sp. McH1-25]MCP1341856.1 M48 family metallopeptidase [Halomonas sp. FL8]MCP1360121.1 M48 family metallopeptidase [Halomonas sp. BBD45]MCP1364791.1 M48 family metallopeptidase [Halomonas sp. BBD48]
MKWMKRSAIGALIVTLAACSQSPTGRSQLTLFSEEQLSEMGAQSFAQYEQQLPVVGGQVNSYVQCVADAITSQLNSGGAWEVKVFRDESANAFALPGGHIGVNTGLLDVATNQDQLAAVIGHEIAHVLADHANERVSQQAATQTGLSILQAAAGLEGAGGQQLMGLLGAGAQYGILMPYSRKHESEADVVGLNLMARAGFDPRESIDLWQSMSANSQGQPPVWMSSHPSHGQRIEGLQAQMDEALELYRQAQASGQTPNCQRPG